MRLVQFFLWCVALCSCGEKSFSQCMKNPSNITSNKHQQMTCYMGTCNNSTCDCFYGWIGQLCDQCHGRVMVNLSSGFVSDGPFNYKNSNSCSWLIQPKIRHSSLKLTLLEFGSECGWDHLYVYDGDSAFSPLLAAYNGLIITSNGLGKVYHPEIIAKSGTAFLQFFSDVAYTLSGFNISYSVDECLFNCSNHGYCADGLCSCYESWTGEACNYEVSSSSCIAPSCNNVKMVWSALSVPSKINPRASYAVASYVDAMWIYSGMSLGNGSPNDLVLYNASTESWVVMNSAQKYPDARYGHTMVFAEGKLLVFGGKLCENQTTVQDLWEFDTKQHTWKLVSYNTSFLPSYYYSSLLLSGHSAHFIQSNVMVVLFGYHPILEYSPFVFHYSLEKETWTRPNLFGAEVPGRYGHSSVYDPHGGQIFIHGGYQATGLSAETFVYTPDINLVVKLSCSGIPRYLHSAVLLGKSMYVFGGNTHNDTSKSTGALCFSSQFMSLDVSYNRWRHMKIPNLHFIERFGHKAVVLTVNKTMEKMYIFSGYNGKMISDLLIYDPNPCQQMYTKNACNGSVAGGMQCVWSNESCVPLMSTSNAFVLDKLSRDNLEKDCIALSNNGCKACLSSVHGCVFCEETQTCHSYTSSPPCSKSCNVPYNIYCPFFKNCFQCEMASSMCTWKKNTCIQGQRTRSVCNINSTCFNQMSCSKCSKISSCMWCLNMQKCIPTNSYVIQFSYGQCFQWTNIESVCKVYNCSSLSSCKKCQSNSKCGWCDDGSETGSGYCVDGGGKGPLNLNQSANLSNMIICPVNRWHFATCPKCQCNGHSKCSTDGRCVHCANNTSGISCQNCVEGYFGDARNRGLCYKCACNQKALACDISSGKCFCFTKGVIGPSCEHCDYGYVGNATGNGTCFYNLTENYQFKFTLKPLEDQHISGINFKNSPSAQDDIQLAFESQKPVTISIFVSIDSRHRTVILAEEKVSSLHETIDANNLHIGTNFKSTIFIYVTNITTPCWIKVSLLQKSNRLLHILLILFSSFLVVLFIAALVWKLKLMYDAYQLRETRAVELKQMAARPFAGVNFVCNELLLDNVTVQITNNRGAALCREYCSHPSLSLVTVLMCMPSEKKDCGDLGNCFGMEIRLVSRLDANTFVFGSTLAFDFCANTTYSSATSDNSVL